MGDDDDGGIPPSLSSLDSLTRSISAGSAGIRGGGTGDDGILWL